MGWRETAKRYKTPTKHAVPASVNGTHPGTTVNGVPRPRVPDAYEAYYDAAHKSFFCQNGRGEWIEYSEKNLERRLREAGFRRDAFHDDGLHYAEKEILRITRDNDVVFAGELAGYDAGIHTILGQRVLITKTRQKVQERKGSWKTLKTFFNNLLGKEVVYLHGWLKTSLAALEAGPDFRPSQCLVIAGPPGSGKNLLQDLITELFGRREAKPYRYMSGATTFNGDLFRAEHLVIQDEPASSDIRTRRIFGANIKAFTVNQNQSYHPKGKQAFPLNPFWRVSVTLNDEPEHMLVLPPLDSDIFHKIILLHCRKHDMPFKPGDDDGRKRFRAELSKALPGYMWWLRRWRIPERLRDQRFGVVHYHSPKLMVAINDLSPEFRLLQLIDTADVWNEFCSMWETTAAEVEQRLKEQHGPAVVERLLTWPSACGLYLGRLAGKVKHRVQRSGHKKPGSECWTIFSPREAPS